MVNYSKWDALELSDDSDIEVHPNVDKRSFIRAKQSQIHMERRERRLQIEVHQYEQSINNTLAERLHTLQSALQTRDSNAPAANPFDYAFQVVMGLAVQNPTEDIPPRRPEGVADADQPLPSYSKMMAGILDELRKEVEKNHIPRDQQYESLIAAIGVHIQNIKSINDDLSAKLIELQKKDEAKITSDSYSTGFDSSHVNKTRQLQQEESSQRVELLNPNHGSVDAPSDSGSPSADTTGSNEVQASAAAKTFASIPPEDYGASRSFISSQPQILRESETDGLLVEAFNIAIENQDDPRVWQCIHQGLLLQYCRSLGANGVSMFFKAINTPGHQAPKIFKQEVDEKYNRIRELAKQSAAESASTGGEEQIQIQALDSESSIQISIPPANSNDEETKNARSIFESFSSDMRAALESGSLDEVNTVLGSMKVPEAEKMVELLGDAGCLSLDEKIIDATTDEGKKRIKDIEEAAAAEVGDIDNDSK